MSAELYAALGGLALIVLGLLGTLLKAWGEQLLTELKTNTRETKAAKTAAQGAQVAAEQVVEQVDWQQKATAYKAELDIANRKLGLVEGLPNCQDCRLKIRELLADKPVDRRRIDPPTEVKL